MNTLTAVILTLNEEAHIAACIDSLRFADEILVFDSYSSDQTVQLAQRTGARVVQRTFDNYANQRNAALAAVGTAWALFIDADERVTPTLAAELTSVLPQEGYAGWRIPRHNYIFGTLTRGAGWYPDHQTRLLRVGAARYDPERKVHEVVQLDGPLGTLTEPLIHYNYRNIAQFIQKQQRYTAYEARILYDQGIRPRPHNYFLQPWRQFRWRFFELGGYRDGLHGLRLSVLMAWYEYRKYILLGRLWR